jgi:CheY-like chemotaxis protein
LTNLRLPDGNGGGGALLRRLQQNGHCPPPASAIAMGVYGGEAEQAKSRAAGFRVHPVKPFTPEELLAALRPATAPPA